MICLILEVIDDMGRQGSGARVGIVTVRTVERVAIAALAAIATRASGESVAFAALWIFIIVVFIEEFGRLWIWAREKSAVSDVDDSTIGGRGVRGRKRRKRVRRRGRGAGARA